MSTFKPISNEILIAANKGATRFLKNLEEFKYLSEEKQALLYFQFVHIFTLLYGEHSEYGFDLLRAYLKKCERNSNVRICIMDTQNAYYSCFWNTFMTTDINGEECSITDYLYNIKTVTNDDKIMYETLHKIVQDLNPIFVSTSMKKHSFTFVYSPENIVRMSFLSNISDEYIKRLFQKIEEIRSVEDLTEIKDCVYKFFSDFHIKYENLIFEEKKTTVEEIVNNYELLKSSADNLKNHNWIKDSDYAYVIMFVYFSGEENDLLLLAKVDNCNDKFKVFYSSLPKEETLKNQFSCFSDQEHTEITEETIVKEIFFFCEYDFFIKNEQINNLEDVIEYLA